jgi:uncharacterized membrane protein YraQ (UPF0718 family)
VEYENLILTFTSIIYEAMPFIVLGVVIAGVLEEFVPQRFIARIIPRSRVLAIAIGGLLGLIFPMCECGIIPVMRRLLRKGVPLSVCVCYILAGPIINVVVILSTYVAFSSPPDKLLGGPQIAPLEIEVFGFAVPLGGPFLAVALRVGFGFIIAFNTSLIVEWQFAKHGNRLLSPRSIRDSAAADDDLPADGERLGLVRRLTNISETALHDFVDIMVFLILGAFLASVVRAAMANMNIEDLLRSSAPIAILLMMALAVLLCLCSEADAFVAAGFGTLAPASAKLAFLVLGPMLDLKLYLMYTRVFRTRLIWTIIVSVVVQVFLFTLAFHYAWESEFPTPQDRPIGATQKK